MSIADDPPPAAMAPPVRLPPPVRPGDRVGVAALSGPVDPGRLADGLDALRQLGFEPVVARNVTAPRHLVLAGDDDERLAAFHELAADPSLAAVLFARGGYGVTRILDRIDWALLARHPRAYVGYSDLTPFLAEVVRRLGLAAFHGPMVAADLARGLSAAERDSLLSALAGELPLSMPLTDWLRPPAAPVAAPLSGGCLSMLVATLGTAFSPRLDGTILVLEDVQEPPYRLDRMLTQLRFAGVLDRLAGLVLGHFDDPAREPLAGSAQRADESDREGEPLRPSALSPSALSPSALWSGLLAEQLAAFDWPVACGLPCGHSPPNYTVPLGLVGQLRADDLSLRVLPPTAGGGAEAATRR
jgi:muramoyltetrapeptide carboxypeptidase